jgi:hypothetical protein
MAPPRLSFRHVLFLARSLPWLQYRLCLSMFSAYYSDDVDLFFCASEDILPSAEKLFARGADANALVLAVLCCTRCLCCVATTAISCPVFVALLANICIVCVCVCACVRACACVCVCVRVCAYLSVCLSVNVCLSLCLCACVNMHMCVCFRTRMVNQPCTLLPTVAP